MNTSIDPKRPEAAPIAKGEHEKSPEEKAREWGDRLPDEEKEPDTEETYRDGSLKNECW